MKPTQLILFFATVGLSLAAGCPFAKFAKAGGDGAPELDHDKLGELLAKMKEYAPHGDASSNTEDFASWHPDLKAEL